MTTQQPKALRLAEKLRDMCSQFDTPSHERGVVNGVIHELRRLQERLEASQKSNTDWATRTHALEAVNARLRAELDELTEQMAAIGAGGVEPLRKRASTAAVAVQEENQDDPLFDAVLTCPHLITAESVTLYFHPAQEGHNASSQLRHRLAAYDLAARQRELQLLSEIEALERLALANLKQQDEIRAARKAAQEEVVELKERIARAGVVQHRAVREAVLQEREACAKVCDPKPGIRYSPNAQSVRQQCAAAIRARQ